MAQPATIYKSGPFKYVWNYLSWKLDDFKAYLLGYRCYRASLFQAGTNPPEAVILENTLGVTVTYDYTGPGEYVAILDKILFSAPDESIDGKKIDIFITPSNSVPPSGSDPLYFSASAVFFNVVDISSYDVGATGFVDDLLGNINSTTFEIRVYNK